MAETTGPILAIGGITLANRVIFNDQDMDWKIPIATGIAAGIFALVEQAQPQAAKAIVYIALLTVCLARVDPGVPSPAESALKWWNSGAGKA